MVQKNAINPKKRCIVVNYLSLIVSLMVFYFAMAYTWSLILVIAIAVALVLFIMSFISGYVRSGLWKFVHQSERKLDEREMQLVLGSVKNAYSIFTILTLIVIYTFALIIQKPLDALIAAGLLYLAHTLPAAIIGWMMKPLADDGE